MTYAAKDSFDCVEKLRDNCIEDCANIDQVKVQCTVLSKHSNVAGDIAMGDASLNNFSHLH